MRIYLAGPLFNDTERERNVMLKKRLCDAGHSVYLPQEDGGVSFNLIAQGGDVAATRRHVFEHDLEEIRVCDCLVAILDGRVPDEGMCVELGMAYALGKKCVGYSTDQRSLDKYGNNLMIEGCLRATAHSAEELLGILQ